jgi:uncharacterized membrane protein
MSTLLRRILHAVLFEIGALFILIPLASGLLGVTLFHFGALALMLSVTAMTCNMLYNHVFEWFERRYAWRRTVPVRVGHAIGFEVVLTFATVPLTAWWMGMGWLQAFALDMGLTVYFLTYGFCFNWIYDLVRRRLAAQPA